MEKVAWFVSAYLCMTYQAWGTQQNLKGIAIPDSYYQPVRIKVFYPEINDTLSQELDRDRLKRSVEEASSIISDFLKVVPVFNNLILERNSRTYCSNVVSPGQCSALKQQGEIENCNIEGFEIPASHLGEVKLYSHQNADPDTAIAAGEGIIDADIAVYVTVKTVSHCKLGAGILAFANVCTRDAAGRPTGSVVNICPEAFHTTPVGQLLDTMKHEFFHALGFMADSIYHFTDCYLEYGLVDCERRQYYSSNQGVPDYLRVHLEDGVFYLISPKVQQAAQVHFNCTEIWFGAAYQVIVEHYDMGTFVPDRADYHWNLTHMLGSIMAPVIREANLLSLDAITLAFFEDTGWYRVNHSFTESLLWGKDAGCDFASVEHCNRVSSGLEKSDYFCDVSKPLGCHYLHLHKGICEPTGSQCYYYKPQIQASCLNIGFTDLSPGEETGMESRCFVSSLHSQNESQTFGACYRRRCNGTSLEVKLFNEWIACPPRTNITIQNVSGYIECPREGVLCTERDLNAKPSVTYKTTTSTTPISAVITPETQSAMHISLKFEEAIFNDVIQNEGTEKKFKDSVTEALARIAGIEQERITHITITAGSVIYSADIQPGEPSLKVIMSSIETALNNGFYVNFTDGKSYQALRFHDDSKTTSSACFQTPLFNLFVIATYFILLIM